MIVFVDTPIWSLALRRKTTSKSDQAYSTELSHLIRQARATLIGPIRQEILSGVRDGTVFELLRSHLRGMDAVTVETIDYEQAACMSNTCRQKGIQGSAADFLLCAVSARYEAPVFTTDRDFLSYAKHLDIALHQPGQHS
jgi:predicted nucleic acid-binding protein